MCEWRIFLPRLIPSDNSWIKDIDSQEQYQNSLAILDQSLNAYFSSQGNDFEEARTDRYYVGTDDIGLKYR